MKKLSVSIVVLFMTLVNLKAQEGVPTKGDLTVLFKIGINGAIYVSDEYENENAEREPALIIGGNIDYFLSSTWSLRSGLIYEQRHYQHEEPAFELEASYLTVPLTINSHIGKKKRWNVNFGPSISINLASRMDKVNIMNDTKTLDVGGELGTGYQLPLGRLSLYFEINSFVGFYSPEIGGDDETRWTRSSINIGLIY
jgi:hypothetical protein